MGCFLLRDVLPRAQHAHGLSSPCPVQHPRLGVQIHYFVLAYPQADLDKDIWMELPIGIVVSGKADSLKQASLNWFEKLKQGLVD
jgi:hypothetical protein